MKKKNPMTSLHSFALHSKNVLSKRTENWYCVIFYYTLSISSTQVYLQHARMNIFVHMYTVNKCRVIKYFMYVKYNCLLHFMCAFVAVCIPKDKSRVKLQKFKLPIVCVFYYTFLLVLFSSSFFLSYFSQTQ